MSPTTTDLALVDPNSLAEPGWDPFIPDGLQTMVFDTASAQQRYPRERTLRAYRQHLPEVLDLVDP